MFSCFWMKLSIFDRILRAVMVVDGAVESGEATYDLGEEMVRF